MLESQLIYQQIEDHFSYQDVWDWQKYLQQMIIRRRKAGIVPPNYLLLCEHAPVYTLGKSADISNLKITKEKIDANNWTIHHINRGGDITFHGPGQITGYPIMDLDQFYHDLHRYVRELEEVIINVISHFGLKGGRIKEFTGVWLDVDKSSKRKICAIGVHISRWVTMHGFALNVNTPLSYFDHIIPCGIVDPDKSVTSIQKEIGEEVDISRVKQLICEEFCKIFDCELIHTRPETL